MLLKKTSFFRSKTTGCLETSNPAEDNSHDEHPLRILSEENLTVVSTFVADLAELEADQAELEALETASRLSFFKVDIFQSYLSVYSSICISFYLSIYLSFFLSMYLSFFLSIYLSLSIYARDLFKG